MVKINSHHDVIVPDRWHHLEDKHTDTQTAELSDRKNDREESYRKVSAQGFPNAAIQSQHSSHVLAVSTFPTPETTFIIIQYCIAGFDSAIPTVNPNKEFIAPDKV